MRNARLDELQAGIKITGRNKNNLRYTDDTTLIISTTFALKPSYASHTKPLPKTKHTSLFTKQSQGLLVTPQESWIIFWAISYELFFRYWSPLTRQRRWLCDERMTVWWPDKSHSTSKNCPQEVGTLKPEINCTQNHQDGAEWTAMSLISRCLSELPMTIATDPEITVCHPAPSLHPCNLKLPFENFCLLSSNREVVLGPSSTFSPGCCHPK